MGYVDKEMLHSVGEGSVANIVEKDGKFSATAFVVGDFDTLLAQDLEGTAHKVQCSKHVAETGVHGTRIDQMGETKLLYAPLTLKERMVDDC